MANHNPPLAVRIRPKSIEEFSGQDHLVGNGKPLRVLLERGELPGSIIFWGPPGCGKTTLARLISKKVNFDFVELSAVRAGKSDVEKVINNSRLMNKKTILFLDEIHRFNKVQQDFLLPYVESGAITLIGATTENPSFEVIAPLLSRSRVFVLENLSEDNLISIIDRALTHPLGLNNKLNLSEENKKLIVNLSNGDARNALNILELISSISISGFVSREVILNAVQKSLRYDKSGEEHYNIISAMHKSLRDSDVQASIYWVMRMVESGEDPEYIVRRMIRFASEDIGIADTNALSQAVNTLQAVKFLGYPECNTALVQCAIYLASSPKSNKVYEAVNKTKEIISKTGNLPVPLHLRNPVTKLSKELDYGKGYKYAPDFMDSKVEQIHLPKEIDKEEFYSPSEQGFESEIKRRITDHKNKKPNK